MNTVKEIAGEPLRFLVDSDVLGQPPYLVDFGEHEGMGQCACKDWRTRRKALIEAGDKSRRAECKHVERAGRVFRMLMVKRVLRQVKVSENANKAQRRGA